MAEIVEFTDARAAEIRSRAESGRTEYQDQAVPALRLGMSPTAASWSVLKRIPGGPMARVLIGGADDVAAGEARKLAKIDIGKLQQGIHPDAPKRQRKTDRPAFGG